jgi:hypothetical protein
MPMFGKLILLGALALASEDVAAVLQRQTQELLDALAPGERAVWDRYLDARALYTTEEGTVLSKSEMLEQLRGLPEGVSGTIRVTDFKVAEHGSVAVATYVVDEHEIYYGHLLHCQYRTTETWVKTEAGWRLIAGQVLALRTDPPEIPLTPQQMDAYVGRYSLTPTITYEIRRKGEALEGQRAGRDPEVLRAEAPDVLFVPGNPRYRKVFLRGPDGRVKGFAERREAWDLPWTKL